MVAVDDRATLARLSDSPRVRLVNDVRLNLGYSLLWCGNTRGFMEQLRAVRKTGPDVHELGVYEGAEAHAAPDRKTAIAWYQRGIEEAVPLTAKAYLERALAVRLMGGGTPCEQQRARESLLSVAEHFFSSEMPGEGWLCVEIAAIVGERDAPSSIATLPPSPMIHTHVRLCRLLARALDERGIEEARTFLRDEPHAIAPMYHPLRDWLAQVLFEHDRAHGLLVAPDTRWFEYSGDARVDLTRRPVLQRLFAALVAHHRASGQGLEPDALIGATWPDERILPSAARNRLRVAVSGLRSLGLGPVIQNVEGRYRLDPNVRVLAPPTDPRQGISMAPRSHHGTREVPH